MLVKLDNISKDYTKNILIIDDFILGAYEIAKVDRISQDSPILILAFDQMSARARKVYHTSGAGYTIITKFEINIICSVKPLHCFIIVNFGALGVREDTFTFLLAINSCKNIIANNYKKMEKNENR